MDFLVWIAKLFAKFFSRSQSGKSNFHVALGFARKVNQFFCEIEDANRIAHIEHQCVPMVSDGAGFQNDFWIRAGAGPAPGGTSNVEIALQFAGVSAKERRTRAMDALRATGRMLQPAAAAAAGACVGASSRLVRRMPLCSPAAASAAASTATPPIAAAADVDGERRLPQSI